MTTSQLHHSYVENIIFILWFIIHILVTSSLITNCSKGVPASSVVEKRKRKPIKSFTHRDTTATENRREKTKKDSEKIKTDKTESTKYSKCTDHDSEPQNKMFDIPQQKSRRDNKSHRHRKEHDHHHYGPTESSSSISPSPPNDELMQYFDTNKELGLADRVRQEHLLKRMPLEDRARFKRALHDQKNSGTGSSSKSKKEAPPPEVVELNSDEEYMPSPGPGEKAL